MSSDAKLQKVILPPDVLDLSFGEPQVVMHALFRQLNRVSSQFHMPSVYDLPSWTYQPASGKPDLVKILEDKYHEKVVVCNGAKQALAAALFAFKKHGINDIWFEQPYYPANPSIIESVGQTWAEIDRASGFLITSPNNPDGKNLSNVEIMNYRHRGFMIHDAAYYSGIYLPEDQIPIPLGHIQVYSMSKMYGLSGLRIGYAVCHDDRFYNDMVEYIETTTAGVSTASQDIARNIELFFKNNPSFYEEFVKESRAAIRASREALNDLDPEVLQLQPCNSNSMFAWCKIGPRLDNKAAKVHILPGELFGQPGMMRMNIAYPPEIIKEAVKRLNENKKK